MLDTFVKLLDFDFYVFQEEDVLAAYNEYIANFKANISENRSTVSSTPL